MIACMPTVPDPIVFRFDPVRAPTLKERVAAQIRTAILRGDLTPGSRIVESQLAKQMNVAQTTVREAMAELANQGLVVKYVNRETLVRKLAPADLQKLYRLRVELEGLAAELAQPHANRKSLRPLYATVGQMRRAAARKDIAQFYEFDLIFHHQLAALTGNEFLERAIGTISVGPFAFVLAGFPSPLEANYIQVADDHAQILDVLRDGTPQAARKMIEEKLSSWHQIQLQLLEGRERSAAASQRE